MKILTKKEHKELDRAVGKDILERDMIKRLKDVLKTAKFFEKKNVNSPETKDYYRGQRILLQNLIKEFKGLEK